MQINGKDISAHDAKQWRVKIGQTELENESEWVRGAPLPIFDKNARGFKELTVTLIVAGENREKIRNKISDILAELLEPVELVLDGFIRRFKGILQKQEVTEFSDASRERFQALELVFDGYEYGTEVSASGQGEIEILNPGNVASPAVIELTPTIGEASITVSGICRDSESGEDLPVTVKNLTTGKKIVIDGITGLITEDGELKAGDVEIWALPSVKPGSNTVAISSEYVNVTVKVRPIYI